MRTKLIFLFVITVLALSLPLLAQEGGEAGPVAEISWPPPVYLLSGEVALRGTVTLSETTVYYVEYRALDEDFTAPEERPYLPATLPATAVVVDGVLGVWDTSAVEDGLYELRLTVILRGEEIQHRTMGPLRIENAGAAEVEAGTEMMMEPEAEPAAMEEPEDEPEPEPMVEVATAVPEPEEAPAVMVESPQVTARVNANIRAGDSTSFHAIDALLTGERAPILGISSRNNGWYQISLPNGQRGWISEVVVHVSGPTDDLPRIVPPALPRPRPTATPAAAHADLVVEWINLEPEQPLCNKAVKITAQIANIGRGHSRYSGSISVQDWHLSSGSGAATTVGGFPPLAPGQRFHAIMHLTVNTWYDDVHRLNVQVDSTNTVAESNEGNNNASRDYTLKKDKC